MNERSIFMAALERETATERLAYLDEACGDDAALRRRLEALLASHEQAGSFLARPVPERLAEKPGLPKETHGELPAAEDGPGSLAEGLGNRIGAYNSMASEVNRCARTWRSLIPA